MALSVNNVVVAIPLALIAQCPRALTLHCAQRCLQTASALLRKGRTLSIENVQLFLKFLTLVFIPRSCIYPIYPEQARRCFFTSHKTYMLCWQLMSGKIQDSISLNSEKVMPSYLILYRLVFSWRRSNLVYILVFYRTTFLSLE